MTLREWTAAPSQVYICDRSGNTKKKREGCKKGDDDNTVTNKEDHSIAPYCPMGDFDMSMREYIWKVIYRSAACRIPIL